MGARRRKIDYDLDDNSDIFVAPTWPDPYLKDPAYALFRPLYERTNPWRSNYASLYQYINSQARRLGGRRILFFHFSNLALLASDYPQFNSFLSAPFTPTHDLTQVFSEMEQFLRQRFETTDDPWLGFPVQEAVAAKGHISERDLVQTVPTTLTEQDRKKLLKKELAKIPWQQQLQRSLEHEGMESFHTSLIDNALKECPELLSQRTNEDAVQQIFSSPIPELTLQMGQEDYLIAEIPVMLGSHYLNRKTQKVWFDSRGKHFYRILGCYARWDDAKVVIFRYSVHDDAEKQKQMFFTIKEQMSLISVGNWKKAQLDGIDYYLSLLIDSDIPERSFVVSEWDLNCPQLSILDKDTKCQ